MGQTALQGPPVVPPTLPETEHECLNKEGESATPHPVVPPVVDVVGIEQGVPIQGTSQTQADHGRQPIRLGGTSPNSHDTRSMVIVRSLTQYKLARVESNTPSPPSLFRTCGGETCPDNDGQRSSQGTCKQTGRDPVMVPYAGGTGSGAVGRVHPGVHLCGEHIRRGESASQFTEQSDSRSLRVETGPGSVPGNFEAVRTTAGGFVCFGGKFPSPKVLHQVLVAGGGGNGCPPQQVAKGTALRLSSTSTHSGYHPQAPSGTGRSNLGGSTLAKMAMVCRPHGLVAVSSVEDSAEPHSTQSGISNIQIPSGFN
ncbi:uncharacterized protein LOC120299160 isoform X2 [Crotalus tigris]|uniref:uncharacterized protein LOC120299160 isoform X2 n=1 Tax=Crotalus tigris TaxID=88082 RepID=UPI00192F5A20|nr:uncharacterized protein LOC120299160 isoform X2 [Crotalus tigris]